MRLTRDGYPAIAVRGQAAYTSEPDPSGLPKLIVDEVDYLIAGQIADNFSYFGEVYALDGGRVGSGREAWLQYSSLHQRSSHAFRITAGLVTLPLPLEPEAFRETNQHYAVWDQTVGNDTFSFFDPHNALWFGYGTSERGTSVSALAVEARDPASALRSSGLDRMFTLKHVAGPFVLDAYRYDGARPTGTVRDAFWREGAGASVYAGRFAVNVVAQKGSDGSAWGDGIAVASSGDFVQLRYEIMPKSFAIVRYDAADDGTSATTRTVTVGAGTHLGKHFRLELEDVLNHVPSTSHTLNAVFGFGFSNASGSQAY